MHKSDEEGFTLIEILVVILIIGILAAIAVPVFLNQRQTANDAVVISDGKNIALAIETYKTNNPTATTIPVAEIKKTAKLSSRVGFQVMGSVDDFCLTGWHHNGKQYTGSADWSKGRPYYVYSSKLGGDVSMEDYPSGASNLSCYFDVQSY